MAGHNMIRMTDLASLFREKGFTDAETFIQSGNVIFSDPGGRSVKEITALVEEAISGRFGLTIPALVRDIPDMKKIITKNPFLDEPGFDPTKMAVMFLYGEPDEERLAKLNELSYPPDKFEVISREVFIWCPNGFGRTKLYTNFFEGKLKVNGTARNWNTINTILGIAETKAAKSSGSGK